MLDEMTTDAIDLASGFDIATESGALIPAPSPHAAAVFGEAPVVAQPMQGGSAATFKISCSA